VLGAAVVGGLLALVIFAAGSRLFGLFSSGEPVPPPPTDRVENAPAPDNRITTPPARSDPG